MHKISSKEQFEKAKESASKLWTAVQNTAVNLGKVLRQSGKTAAYTLDGVDKWIGSKIKTKKVLLQKMKYHLLKIALATGVLFHYVPKTYNPIENITQKSESKTDLVHGIDVSHFNDFDMEEFVQENDRLRNDGDTLTPPKEFIILRATQGVWTHQSGKKKGKNLNDVKFSEFASQVKAHNDYCDEDEKILLATYHLYVPWHAVEKQVDNYWNELCSTLGKAEAKKQKPILDIEMSDINAAKDKSALFDNLLKWCELAEKKFGTKPLIYTSNSAINDYFRKDKRFDGYKFWSAAYGNNKITPELVQQQWGTEVLAQSDIDIHQFTENGKVAGMGNSRGQTDINVMSRADYEKYFSA